MGNDTIANMITSIRNANLGKIKTVQVPATNITRNIAKILFQEGFIDNFIDNKQNTKDILILNLKYQGKKKKSYITTLRRISKPGLRIYSNHKEIPKVLGGMGIVILSTSRGIMTDREARQKKIGGELLCYVW
ncbi:ribosomal protein S8 (chloroplast) [Marchantia polymorpha subsp. ruderalis]|uniref:Small ribosomal subunit protein uS8c n=5 Tax=Marchantia TaxID=3196 RepID=RR8_MARPO|nr:ribosomal protein S8 [Marchantia paleacea]YP_009479652.1 ribosomal protein S8 [Marchantia polymorpha subsp. ruderalis]YP_009646848.1 ribosomal protein S8 [Marchantia polymorpha]P06362.1 RecName: Full=Small ribosomal subunit protein uS8c; AltName: Full=30S ribosomal protein S8, chloroplastic [Marchantia polymorpha]BAS44756.1 30S ribosomal protein S8 [Marchantia paleacea subsp. diptera]BDW46180.1 ribosomal protein S8 [Marchantia emarginata subsp. cuneiloba]AXJ93250.1 ribosomal protein S8 [Ma